jgi:hypothetical protein
MRRGLALLAALGLILSLPIGASAAKATRFTDHVVSLSCDGIVASSGTGFAFFEAHASSAFGPDAFLDMWLATAPNGNPDISRDPDASVAVTWDGTTLAGTVPLIGPNQSSLTATFSATLTPVGDPYVIDDSFKDGNHQNKATGMGQAMQPVGTLTISSGQTFDLGACFGDDSTISTFSTNPASFVNHFTDRFAACPLTSTAGDDGSIFIDYSSDTEAFVDSVVFPSGGGTNIGASGSGPIVGGLLDFDLGTYNWDTGAPLAVPAHVHATLTETSDKYTVDFHNGNSRRISRGTLVDIEGTLTIGTAVFDLSSCVGANGRTKDMFIPKQGPKPGGKVPTNDKPAGAIQLAVGKSTATQTKGASVDREAPYECLTFPQEDGSLFEVPVANTVWYKVTGTGASITIDTTGSDFDTVMQVYTSSAGGGFTFVPDGCDDDVPQVPFGRSLQAAVTIPTVAGTTYYVQIGGFPDTNFPYGNLKVAVR